MYSVTLQCTLLTCWRWSRWRPKPCGMEEKKVQAMAVIGGIHEYSA
jgi:hypothetical protein